MRRTVVMLMVLLGVAAPGLADAAELLVVYQVQDSSRRFRKADIDQLSDYLAAKMVEGRKFRVVPRARVTSQVAKRQRKPCGDWECQAAVAWQLKATKVLSTTLLKLGRKCTVVATLYDVKSASSVASANIRCGCTTDDLVGAIDQVPAVLAGAKPKAVAAAKKPVAKKPVAKKPVAKKPVAKKPVAKKPVAKKPVAKKPVAKKPVAKKPVAKKPVARPKRGGPPDEPGLVALSKRTIRTHGSAKAKPRKPFPMWPGLVAAGVGVVGLGVGIPLLAIDGNPTDCLGDALPDNRNCARLYNTKAAGWTFTALGITGLAASGVLFYFNLTSKGKESKSRTGVQVVTITPIGDEGVALGAVGRF